jgi:alkylation response protein AidB-like acyl-CoA dehydrogenase
VSLAIEPDHLSLSSVARAFLTEKSAMAAARAALDADEETIPPYWAEMAALGWMGLHLPEAYGGAGFGLLELAIVLEEMGRVVAGGPFLPTVLASAVLAATGSPAQCDRWLPGLARGELVGAVGLSETETDRSGAAAFDPVLGAHLADVLLLPAGGDMVLVEGGDPGLSVLACPSLDRSRRVAHVTYRLPDDLMAATLPGAVAVARQLSRTMAAAEAAGGARACVEMASAYARDRVQFGRPIGTFQAVKHRCADMLAQAELATAVAWDAARTNGVLSAAAAVSVALPAYLVCATDNIQVHGGVGFTWEHDAHLHLRRAAALGSWCGRVGDARLEVYELSGDRAVELDGLDLPEEGAALRQELRAFRTTYESLPPSERQAALIDAGLLLPHWPRPWGRDATAMEQIIMDQELAGIPRGHPFAWVALTLVSWADARQQELWVRPVLEGSLTICQLFSEPGAGSDLASLRCRASRVEGGWSVTGQKVWTSSGHHAAFGFALVRTDPEASKRAGITAMMLDMRSPGVEVRPIRQITGEAQFDEVFLDEVFVPDENVVGAVNEGWKVARATMGNERVALGGGGGYIGIDKLLACARAHAGDDRALGEQVGDILAEHRALGALDLRRTSRALSGGEPGVEGNITKLLGNELDQRMTRLAMQLLGAAAAGADGGAAEWSQLFLFAPCLTIGGGTSEMARNAIAERMLGLPRDPILP